MILSLNVFGSALQTLMGEDDFGGNVGGMRFVDKVLSCDFPNEFVRIASPELHGHFVGCSVDPADANHSVVDFDEEVAVPFFPAAGELELIAEDHFPGVVNFDRNSKTLSHDFFHPHIRAVFRGFFKKFIGWSKARDKTQSSAQ
jgi:hypothetical protein